MQVNEAKGPNALNGLELYYNCIETKETATMYTYKNHREKIFETSTMSTTLRKHYERNWFCGCVRQNGFGFPLI